MAEQPMSLEELLAADPSAFAGPAAGPVPIGPAVGPVLPVPTGQTVQTLNPDQLDLPEDKTYDDLTPQEQAALFRAQIGSQPEQARTRLQEIPPRYFEGDEWLPASVGPHGVWQLQQSLTQAGFLTGNFTRGGWDRSTMFAFKELLGFANASGQTWQGAIAQIVGAGGGPSSGAGGGGAVLPNPDDIRAVAQRVAQEILGRDPTGQEAAAVVQAVQKEAAAVNPANAATRAETVLREQAPVEADANAALGAYNSFLGAIGAG